MLNRLILDIAEKQIITDSGELLGYTGDTNIEIDHDKGKVYMTVNLIMDAGAFRKAVDAVKEKLENPVSRSIKL